MVGGLTLLGSESCQELIFFRGVIVFRVYLVLGKPKLELRIRRSKDFFIFFPHKWSINVPLTRLETFWGHSLRLG